MSFEFYKIAHILGLLLLFSGLAMALTMKMAGIPFQGSAKKMAFISHGVGLLIMLIAGFGMLAKMGLMGGLPGWVYAKLGVWLLLGGSVTLAKKKGQIGWPLLVLFIGLGTTAAWLAIVIADDPTAGETQGRLNACDRKQPSDWRFKAQLEV